MSEYELIQRQLELESVVIRAELARASKFNLSCQLDHIQLMSGSSPARENIKLAHFCVLIFQLFSKQKFK
jgi:hypothetical protein